MRVHIQTTLVSLVLLVVLLCTGLSSAGYVCRNKDCSDVVGEFMTKDNRLSSRLITHREHLDYLEQSRIRRIDILRRERPSM